MIFDINIANILQSTMKFNTTNVAVVAASTAAIFTAYQALLLRKHNRLSIKPHLDSYIHDTDANQEYTINFYIDNNGIGPAVIKKFTIYFDGKKLGDNRNRIALSDSISKKVIANSKILRHTISILGYKSVFPAQKRELLLSIGIPITMGFDKKEFQDWIDRFDLHISYASIYGKRYKFKT